jgi:hypothetical protein
MALKREDEFDYGECQADIREAISEYGSRNGYPPHHFADAVCRCGSRCFRLELDDNEGTAVRVCTRCGDSHAIGDSEDYLDDAELEECECPCGKNEFEITVGISLYTDSEDVRWFYLGCRCQSCGLTAVYGDWKNEFIGYQEFLSRV